MAWLIDTAACGGEEAYIKLLSASKEGEIQLPTHVEIYHSNGYNVHIGPSLSTPSARHISKTPAITIEEQKGLLVIKHQAGDLPQQIREAWEFDVTQTDGGEEKKSEYKDFKEEKGSKGELLKDKIYVSSHDILSVSLDQIRAHFEQFDAVMDITALDDSVMVTLKSESIVKALAGKNHTLHRAPEQGGCVPLRLRGGSGRVQGGPPYQQRDNTCPFR